MSYDADGIRQHRYNSDAGLTYDYYYSAGHLATMCFYDSVVMGEFQFKYDDNGMPISAEYLVEYPYEGEYGITEYIEYYGTYYFVRNIQGDVIALVDESGNRLVEYTYDAWGNILDTVYYGDAQYYAAYNPFRYRGYVYDIETGLYYLNSRYYDPEIGRFISTDTTDILTATPMGLTDKNLYAYCDNNPVVRVDRGGQFWESVFDVISLGASIVEVCVNPTDIWAWAGLVGDAVDLIPFVTGVGEVTRAVKTTVKVADKATDVLDTANTLYKTADAASDIRKATGSYEIVYKSGKNYIGKGNFNRAMTSAKAHAESVDDILSIRWKSAPSSRDAFIDEYLMQRRFGGVLSGDQELLTYNKIWSPGRRYYGR